MAGDDRPEAVVGKRQLRAVGLADRHAPALVGHGPQHRHRQVDAHHVQPHLGQRQGDAARADPDLEHGAVADQGIGQHGRHLRRRFRRQRTGGVVVPRRPVEADRRPLRPAHAATGAVSADRRNVEQLVAAADERAQRRLLAEGPQHLDLGRHARDHRVGGQQQQPRVVAAHAAGVHLGLEERRRPGRRAASRRVEQPGRRRRAEPGDLPQEARASSGGGRRGGTSPHDRLDPAEPVARRRPAPRSSAAGHLVGAAVDDRVEQRLLRREPVEDRLLADAELAGQVVERRGLVARGCRRRRWRRRGCGRRSAAVTGRPRATLPNGRQVGDDRRGTRRQAHRHHRRDRLPRHRPRRAAAALACPAASSSCSIRPGRRSHGRRSGPSGRSSATTPSTACASELGQATASTQMVDRRVHGRSPATSAPTASASTTPAGPLLAALRHRHPLGRHGVLRLAARRRRRGQPARPHPHRRRRSTTSASRPTSSPCPPATSPATAGARRPRQLVDDEPVLHRRRLARRGRRAPAGRAPTPRPTAARPETLGRVPQARPATSSAPPARPLLAAKTEQRRERVGQGPAWSRPAGPAPRRSAGPTPTPTPRRSASGRCCENRGDVPVSIVRPVDHRVGAGRARARAGSAASAWPSR